MTLKRRDVARSIAVNDKEEPEEFRWREVEEGEKIMMMR
jgi:hypothetical protein